MLAVGMCVCTPGESAFECGYSSAQNTTKPVVCQVAWGSTPRIPTTQLPTPHPLPPCTRPTPPSKSQSRLLAKILTHSQIPSVREQIPLVMEHLEIPQSLQQPQPCRTPSTRRRIPLGLGHLRIQLRPWIWRQLTPLLPMLHRYKPRKQLLISQDMLLKCQ